MAESSPSEGLPLPSKVGPLKGRALPYWMQVQRQQAAKPARAARCVTKAIADVNLVVGGEWCIGTAGRGACLHALLLTAEDGDQRLAAVEIVGSGSSSARQAGCRASRV